MQSPLEALDLKSLKRSQLQKLAKQYGIRANMKNGDIITALGQVSQTESNEQCVKEETTESSKDPVREMTASPSESGFDLMSVAPPWISKNLDVELSPDEDRESEQTRTKANDKSAHNEKRTRSSSRNRTPKSTDGRVRQPDGKTFSVERKTTKARLAPLKKTNEVKKPNAMKKKSTDRLSEVTQSKRIKTSNDGGVDINTGINKKLKKQIANIDTQKPNTKTEDASSSRIPRFAASGVSIGTSKAMTPARTDFKKLHSRTFAKMESIDDYEKRKRERAERLFGSNRRNNATITKLAQSTKRGGSKIVKPVIGKDRSLPSFSSPAPAVTVTPKTPRSIMKKSKTENGSAVKRKSPRTANKAVFKPTVTSTKNMSFDFNKKSSKLATPKRVTIVSDQNASKQPYQKTPGTGMRNKSVLHTPKENRKSLISTPKTLNTSVNYVTTPGGTKRSAFNLEESLKKPLSWKPHRGPLRPFNDTSKKPTFQERMKNIKNPKVADREKRKQKLVDQKKQAKDKRMMQRRGIK